MLSTLTVLALVCLAILAMALHRRHELRALQGTREQLRDARERGSHRARLQHPFVDLSQCIGCGSCVRACPEEGVLDLVHGQAVIVHGARCVGHGRCADACPVGAIALTLGDLSGRRDLPALEADLEASGVPGLFIAGELGGYALVRTAIEQGRAAADAAMEFLEPPVRESDPRVQDLVVVGSGPAGLSCALRSQELGRPALVLEQEPGIGGSVARYPRRKLVMTQPMELPLHGRLKKLSYQKEELVALWEEVSAGHGIDVRFGQRLQRIQRTPEGPFELDLGAQRLQARAVVLALGRRGTPRRLGVPGEELGKVAYELLDAAGVQDQHVLVVGGGDSAVEAALGLAAQRGNVVTLSYRKHDFFRLKARNEKRVRAAIAKGELQVLFSSDVRAIHEDYVDMDVAGSPRRLCNDLVYVFAGGIPPFGILEDAGVSFDPADRPQQAIPTERGNSIVVPMTMSLAALAILGLWAWMHRDYYELLGVERGLHAKHPWLAPSRGFGLFAALLGTGAIVLNLLYLLRRSFRVGRLLPGALSSWMKMHVFTGLLAFLLILLHAGFAPRHSVGGHAFLALTVVVVAGALGRYLYSLVPRSANGAELRLADLRAELARLGGVQDRSARGFGAEVRREVESLIQRDSWTHGPIRRVLTLLRGQVELRRTLRRLRHEGRQNDVPPAEVARATLLARQAYRLTLATMHYEELRGILQSWRYVHRWLALLLVLLAIVHIVVALDFAELQFWPDTPMGRPA